VSNSLDPWGANERRELRHATHSLEGAIKEIATLRAALAESERERAAWRAAMEHELALDDSFARRAAAMDGNAPMPCECGRCERFRAALGKAGER
jgi:hypothetical protein